MAVTRRRLQELGLEWPWPYPFDLDEPLDLARAMTDLGYGDLMDYAGGRSSYLDFQRERTKGIIERLDELGIAWRTNATPAGPRAVASAVRTSPGLQAVAQAEGIHPEPAPSRPIAPIAPIAPPITRRKLAALGVSVPRGWGHDAEDTTIDIAWHLENLETHVAEGRPGYAGDLEAARSVVKRLDELGIPWRASALRAPRPTVTRRMLNARGLSLPFSPLFPFGLDEPIDLEAALERLEGADREAVERIVRGLEER